MYNCSTGHAALRALFTLLPDPRPAPIRRVPRPRPIPPIYACAGCHRRKVAHPTDLCPVCDGPSRRLQARP